MLNNKIKYILVLFIILTLSMNTFSATNFDDNSNVAIGSSDSVDKVGDDQAISNDQNNAESDSGSNGSSSGANSGSSSFNFNRSGSSSGLNFSGMNFSDMGSSGMNFSGMNFSGMNFSGMNFSGMNFSNRSSDMNISDILSKFLELMGGKNETTNTTVSEVSDVPKVVTSTNYAVSHPPVNTNNQHIVMRIRDNKTVNEGNFMILDGINKLYDSDFTNGHLLVYVDGKLVFNEITADDLSTPIFEITDSYLGQHQIVVEFTPNDGNSNTNKFTEDVFIK